MDETPATVVPFIDRRRVAPDGTARHAEPDGQPSPLPVVVVGGPPSRLEMGERIAAILAGGPVPTDEAGKRAVADEVTAEVLKMTRGVRHQSTREMQRRLRQAAPRG